MKHYRHARREPSNDKIYMYPQEYREDAPQRVYQYEGIEFRFSLEDGITGDESDIMQYMAQVARIRNNR